MKSFKFMIPIIALIGLTTAGYSQSNDCCPEPNPCCDEVMAPTTSGYNQSARIDVCNSWNLYLTGTFLWWEPRQEQLTIAETNVGLMTVEGKVIDVQFEYKPGFKAGIGYNTNHDNWNVYLQYTRLNSTTSNTVKIGSATNLRNLTTFSAGVPTNNSTEIRIKWKLDHNIFDLELGRGSYNGTKLTIAPHWGIRSGWIDQNFHATDIGTSTLTADHSSDSWLLGLRTGVYTNWFFVKKFRAIGNGAVSVYYQKFDQIRLHGLNVTTPTALNKIITYKEGFLNSSIELLLGVAWGTSFSNNDWYFDLSAAYEAQIFFNQNMMRYVEEVASGSSFTKPGNLMLHGLNVTARFDF